MEKRKQTYAAGLADTDLEERKWSGLVGGAAGAVRREGNEGLVCPTAPHMMWALLQGNLGCHPRLPRLPAKTRTSNHGQHPFEHCMLGIDEWPGKLPPNMPHGAAFG